MNRSKGDWVVQQKTPKLSAADYARRTEEGFVSHIHYPGGVWTDTAIEYRGYTFADACDEMIVEHGGRCKFRVVRR